MSWYEETIVLFAERLKEKFAVDEEQLRVICEVWREVCRERPFPERRKKPMSGYNLFVRERQKDASFSGLTQQERIKKLGAAWSEMKVDEQIEWCERAKEGGEGGGAAVGGGSNIKKIGDEG
jgi:hypothetical protein